mgnify:CR=1 FL=1
MLNGNQGIQIGDLKYPRAIYTLWTEAERNAIGIYTVEYDDSNKKDEKWYINTDQSYAFADNKVTASYGSATAKAHADVNAVDEDGNEIAGIRLPPVETPIATTTGWALRRDDFGLDDGCEGSGQYIPFAVTEDERLSIGDPRLSLEERYGTHENYVQEVASVAEELMHQGFLLEADVQRYIDQAASSDVLQ